MTQTKSFASLSSGLLARKGAAKPAMRPQGVGQFTAGMEDLGWNDMGHGMPVKAAPAARFEARREAHAPSPITALTPMAAAAVETGEYEPAPPVVAQQHAAIQASFAGPAGPADEHEVLSSEAAKTAADHVREVEPAAPKPKQAGAKTKAAFTLRLEAERHLKLRLACAVTGRSAQQLVTEALDQLLQSKPEIGELAERVPGQTRR